MRLAVIAASVLGAATITVTTLPRPPFPGPVTAAPDAKRLVVVSSRKISPGLGTGSPSCPFTGIPSSLRGLPLQRTICPGGPKFSFYGKDGASSRILLSSTGYALDFKKYVWPPRNLPGEKEFVYEELVWAREANGVLYVQNAHLTYARSSYGQNAYITAIDAETNAQALAEPRPRRQCADVRRHARLHPLGLRLHGGGRLALPPRPAHGPRRRAPEPPQRAREDHPQRNELRRAHVRPRARRPPASILRCSRPATPLHSGQPSGVLPPRPSRSGNCSSTGRSCCSSTSGTGRARERPRWSSCVTGGRSSRRRA